MFVHFSKQSLYRPLSFFPVMATLLAVLVVTSAHASSTFAGGTNSLKAFSTSMHAYAYQAPHIAGWGPATLQTDKSKTLSLGGQGFFSNSVVLVNGHAVPTTYQNYGHLLAQVFVPDNAVGSIAVQMYNSGKGGGYSNVVHVPIQQKTLAVDGYSSDSADPSIALLGQQVQFFDVITSGPGNADATWTLNGAGTLSSSGLYEAPAIFPSNNIVTITASLKTNPAVRASRRLFLEYPLPRINATTPAQLASGRTNTVTINGSGFTPATTFYVNGKRLNTSYQSATAVLAQIGIASRQSGTVSVIANNPAPRGGNGNNYSLEIAAADYAYAQVGGSAGQLIPENFLGFSHEWSGLNWMLGTSSGSDGINNLYRQLIRNLMQGTNYPFFIRIGGYSTDQTGEPNSSMTEPLAELAKGMNVQFSLGVNMASNDPDLARNQAEYYARNMPSGSLAAIEIGNEPDNYGIDGKRSNPYTMTDYLDDFNKWNGGIRSILSSSVNVMGPAWGSVTMLQDNLGRFDQAENSKVRMVSQHLYSGYVDNGQRYASTYLLTPTAVSIGPSRVASGVALAHRSKQQFRIGEMNSIDKGGVKGISDAFGSALWAIDQMFEYIKVGVDGVNWHGNGNCAYCAFTFGNISIDSRHPYTLQNVAPLYYGMVFFQEAASNNARLLPVSLHTSANVKVWATKNQRGTVHVMIINKDLNFAGNVAINLIGYGDAQVTTLTAPSYQSTDGVTIAGQTFDGSIDGKPVGTPVSTVIRSANGGTYTVPVQPATATLLTLY